MGQQIAVDLRRTIHHYIPDLYERLQRITDPRKICDYSITEVLLAGLFMFMLKQDSRNAMNSDRAEKTFAVIQTSHSLTSVRKTIGGSS